MKTGHRLVTTMFLQTVAMQNTRAYSMHAVCHNTRCKESSAGLSSINIRDFNIKGFSVPTIESFVRVRRSDGKIILSDFMAAIEGKERSTCVLTINRAKDRKNTIFDGINSLEYDTTLTKAVNIYTINVMFIHCTITYIACV